MRLVDLPDARPGARSLAIGTFDGVHVGHRDVIEGADSVVTFEPHPSTIVAPGGAPALLTPLPVKADLIASLGVEELIVVRFDAAFAAQPAQEFVDRVLVERLGAREISVGENFRFGARALGDAALLASDGRFGARVVPLREVDGEIVSSSRIRSLIALGDVGAAARLLGDAFELRGTVIDGDRRGRELGFPTANVAPDPNLVSPGHGVYAALANGVPAAVNIGVRPTFGSGRAELIEAFLIDWEGDLYGKELRLRFIERLRGERRFESAEELIDAMHDDVARARAICASATVPRPDAPHD
jgi:riboflavin kinase / FMN adenylyltransferase